MFCLLKQVIIDTKIPGNSITTAGCRTHTCVGDFNEGVQWVTMVADNCTIKPDVVLNRALRFDDFDDNMPTMAPNVSFFTSKYFMCHGFLN